MPLPTAFTFFCFAKVDGEDATTRACSQARCHQSSRNRTSQLQNTCHCRTSRLSSCGGDQPISPRPLSLQSCCFCRALFLTTHGHRHNNYPSAWIQVFSRRVRYYWDCLGTSMKQPSEPTKGDGEYRYCACRHVVTLKKGGMVQTGAELYPCFHCRGLLLDEEVGPLRPLQEHLEEELG